MTAIILLSITRLTILALLLVIGITVVVAYLLSKKASRPICIMLSTADVIVLLGAHNIISEQITDGDLVMPKEKLKELEDVIEKFKAQSYSELATRKDELVMLRASKNIPNFFQP